MGVCERGGDNESAMLADGDIDAMAIHSDMARQREEATTWLPVDRA